MTQKLPSVLNGAQTVLRDMWICIDGAKLASLQYSTVQYSTVQYSTVLYSTIQYSTVQYSTVQIWSVMMQSRIVAGCLWPMLCKDIHILQ